MDAAGFDRWITKCKGNCRVLDGRDGLRVVATSQGDIRIRDVGHGRTVVFVCDGPAIIDHYDRLVELLRTDMRVICMELPGFGFSRPSADCNFGVQSFVHAVREVLEAEGIQRCTLAFGCVAVYVGLLLAAQSPALVEALVLMQAPDWDAELRWINSIDFHGVLQTPYLGQAVLGVAAGRIAQYWINHAIGRQELAPEFVSKARSGLRAGCGWTLTSVMQAFVRPPYPVFGPVELPSLLIWGERDRSHRQSDPRSALKYLPQGRFIAFERAGHFPELEEPERFADVLRAFVSASRT